MKFLFNQVKLLPIEMRDAKTRKAVFREAGKTYTACERDLTDRPGAIARLMEMAFAAGQKAGDSSAGQANHQPKRCRDLDVLPFPRKLIENFRRYKIGRRSDNSPPSLADFAFVRRVEPTFTRSGSQREVWDGCRGNTGDTQSSKTIAPLIRDGLFQKAVIAEEHGQHHDGVALSEWGLELILTGETSAPGDRVEGQSATYQIFCSLLAGTQHDPGQGKISIWDFRPNVAGFLLDHRAHGVGHPERLESGACVDDITYYLETFTSPGMDRAIDVWRHSRHNPEVTSFMSLDVPELISAGLLMKIGERELLISEWAYELITTGVTASIEHRSPNSSSTFEEYNEILKQRPRKKR